MSIANCFNDAPSGPFHTLCELFCGQHVRPASGVDYKATFTGWLCLAGLRLWLLVRRRLGCIRRNGSRRDPLTEIAGHYNALTFA